MRAFVGVTDREWFEFLRARPDLDEVNFWQPSGRRRFRALSPGDVFLFKLHAPWKAIVGGGMYQWSSPFPFTIAWEAFGEGNGAATVGEMRERIERYTRSPVETSSHEVGCIIVRDLFWLDEENWFEPPDWKPGIQQGKVYDLSTFTGRRLWELVQERLQRTSARTTRRVEGPTFGDPVLAKRRLGQGAFMMLVHDAYQRRCAVTGERALPVLQASHIRPVAEGGEHRVDNGVLLRSDVHTLFDRGYVTITPDERLRVSRRLRDEFHNGEAYYALEGRDLLLPGASDDRPSTEFLEWHNDVVFLP